MQSALRNIYVYTYMHTITIKRDLELKREQGGGIQESLEGGKAKEECCDCIIISKIKTEK